jgi:hypothetical protein
MRRIPVLGLALAASVVAASTARADGLPVLGVDVGPDGVAVPGGESRYVTLPAGRDTILARVATVGGGVEVYRTLRGSYTIPAVAYDGSADGLAADGKTLVLIEPRETFPRARTRLAVLDPRNLRTRDLVDLRGDYSFDALSPRGKLLYLVHYVSARDPSRYEVRAYDLGAGRLLPKPIVDPHEAGEAMRGAPITRATSPDGRWAYTLYDGAGKEPFVHALDTTGRTARCIDLEMLAGRDDLFRLRLTLGRGGRTLTVHRGGEALAAIDTTTFAAREPVVAPAPPPRPAPDGGFPWLAIASGAAAAVGAAALLLTLLRRRPHRRPALADD